MQRAVTTTAAEPTWRARFWSTPPAATRCSPPARHSQEARPKHNSAAIFGHFRRRASASPGKLEGNISIFWFDHGWFWFIPLADGTTSVGAVCWPYYLKSRDKPLRDFFVDTIALCADAGRTACATRS